MPYIYVEDEEQRTSSPAAVAAVIILLLLVGLVVYFTSSTSNPLDDVSGSAGVNPTPTQWAPAPSGEASSQPVDKISITENIQQSVKAGGSGVPVNADPLSGVTSGGSGTPGPVLNAEGKVGQRQP